MGNNKPTLEDFLGKKPNGEQASNLAPTADNVVGPKVALEDFLGEKSDKSENTDVSGQSLEPGKDIWGDPIVKAEPVADMMPLAAQSPEQIKGSTFMEPIHQGDLGEKRLLDDIKRSRLWRGLKAGESVVDYGDPTKPTFWRNAQNTVEDAASAVKKNMPESATYEEFMGSLPFVYGETGGQEIDKDLIRSYFKQAPDGTYTTADGKKIYSKALLEKYVDDYYKQYNHPVWMQDEQYRKDYIQKTYGKTEDEFRKESSEKLRERLDDLYTAYEKADRRYHSATVDKTLNDLKEQINSYEKDSFWSGFLEGFSLDDVLLLGLPGLSASIQQLDALTKYANGDELSPEENFLVKASELQQEIQHVRSSLGYGDNSWNRVGQIVGAMPEFGTQMLATAGLPKLSQLAVKEGVKEIAANTVKNTIKEGLKKASLSIADDVIATPFMGMTYQNLADRRLAQYSWEDGELIKDAAPWIKDAYKAFAETFVERHSEQMGEWITAGLLKGGRKLAQTKLFDNAAGRALKQFKGYRMPAALEKVRKDIRMSGYVGEVGSEVYNNLVSPVFTGDAFSGDTERWRELMTTNYWWDLLLSTAIASGAFYSLSLPSLSRYSKEVSGMRRNANSTLAEIQSTELKDKLQVAFASDRYSTDDLTNIDWQNVSSADAERAADYIFYRANEEMLRSEAFETERLNLLLPQLRSVVGSLYQGVDATTPAFGTKVVEATLVDGSSMFVTVGDYSADNSKILIGKTADGQSTVAPIEDVVSVEEHDLSDYIAQQYSLMFSTSLNKERLERVIEDISIANANNASPETIATLITRAGYALYDKGDKVQLSDGTSGTILSVLPAGQWLVQDDQGGVVTVGFLNIMQPNEAVAEAQAELISDIENEPADIVEEVQEDAGYVPAEQMQTERLTNAFNEIAMRNGNNVVIVKLEDGQEVPVYDGNIVSLPDGKIDYSASDETIVVTVSDEAGRAVRRMLSIDEVEAIVEQSTVNDIVGAVEQATKKQVEKVVAISNAIEVASSQGEGVAAKLMSGIEGELVGVNPDGSYMFTYEQDGKEYSQPVTIDDVATFEPVEVRNEEVPDMDTAQEEKAAEKAEIESEQSSVEKNPYVSPVVGVEKIKWSVLSPEEYVNMSLLTVGPAQTLSNSYTYYINSQANLKKAEDRVAEQQQRIAKLQASVKRLASPEEAVSLQSKLKSAEDKRMQLESEAENIRTQMSKYAYAMRKFGIDIESENALMSERASLEVEQAELVEADAELDRTYSEGQGIDKRIVNTEQNRERIYNLYADRGVNLEESTARNIVLWDIATGNIKLKWDSTTSANGAAVKGLAAELGLGKGDRNTYKAILAKNGVSVDAYVHSLWERLSGYSNDIDDMQLKDEVLNVLQSVSNGTRALEELYDNLGIEAEQEEALGKSKADIAEQLAYVDSKLRENAQKIGDFRKRIDNTTQALEKGEPIILPIGEGEFGPIYDQFKGKPQEAVEFLLSQKNGEAIGALKHPEIGDVSLVYGNKSAGLEKIAQKHPEVLNDLQNVLSQMSPIMESANRIKLDSPSHFAVVSKEYMGEPRDKWLLTAYEKKSSASNNRMDTDGTVAGRRNDTATSQDTTYSKDKDTTTIPEIQTSNAEIAIVEDNRTIDDDFYGNVSMVEDVPFSIEPARQYVPKDTAEEAFIRERIDVINDQIRSVGPNVVAANSEEIRRIIDEYEAGREALRLAIAEDADIRAERADIEQKAKADGAWLKAPNGKDTNLTPRQWIDVRTSRFKNWFGDWENVPDNASKVVDENGEPRVVYHGTPNQFNTFNRELIGSSTDQGIWGRGFYFSSDKAYAETYKTRNGVVGEVKELFLNIRNPLTIDIQSGAGKEVLKGLYDKYITDDIFEDVATQDQKLNEAHLKITDEFLAMGYDGVAVTYRDGKQEYVVFSPNQIKSATENIGEFSAANADIRFAIEAYHGSGADFEKFDHSFMSTGEGAQAFGWGTYVTEVENIAKGYAKAMGESKERKERKFAEQTLLIIRENIAKERMFIDRKQKELAAMEELYAKLEGDLQATIFPRNRKRLQETMEELANDIRNAKGEIESSQWQIEQLKPQEAQYAKLWDQFDAPRKIEELKNRIEWAKLDIRNLNYKIEHHAQALDKLEQSNEMSDQVLEDLRSILNFRYLLEGKDAIGAKAAIIAEIERYKGLIEDAERGISNRQKELEELQAIEQPKYRNLYSVEVPDNLGDNYLPWADVLTPEMMDRVYPHIEKALITYLEDVRNRPDAERWNGLAVGMEGILEKYIQGEKRSGEQVYHDLGIALGSAKAASEFLHSIGFTGIEYPAQYTTGGRDDGAKNYVIFNADDVKIVEHIQYLKTPKGVVYGFTIGDTIYIDISELNMETPIHEYTEWWSKIVAKNNPKLWKRGKELLAETETWKEVNADPNYKDLDEDLRASETLSRIAAKEAAKKMSEVSDNKSLIAKLRAWIRKFWGDIKATFAKWGKKDLQNLTVNQFSHMPLRDLFEGVDLQKYRTELAEQAMNNSLVGIHDISLSKLQKALKQGGLANPSAGVIDITKDTNPGFGEYSLIMPKTLVDKKSGRNLGTFDRDAWTPLYPKVEYSQTTTSKKNLNKLVEGLDEGLADKIKRETLQYVNGNGYHSGLQVVFLRSKGVDIPMATKERKFYGTTEDLQQLFGGKEMTYENYLALDKAQKDEITLWIRAKGMPEEIARYKELLVKPARREGLWNFLLEDVGYGKFDQALYGLKQDERTAGTPDYGKTIDNAVKYIVDNGMQEEFDAWQIETINNLGFDERIQVGVSPNGNRIMRKNTLENVSKYMRSQGTNASKDHWSATEGKMLAMLAQNFSSLEEIRQNKGRLGVVGESPIEMRKRINAAVQMFMDFSKSRDLFLEEQSAFAYLEDILIGGMNPDKVVAEYNAATKRNITITDEQKAELKQLREDMKNIPAQYFEIKFGRPVMFSEFAAVVAPNTMPEAVEKQLRDAGLQIYKYDPSVEDSRREATLAATNSENIRFMIVGEKGADALDKAEEATTRLDNLAVAKEMEAEFSVDTVNARFNEELQHQINGSLPQGHIYKMGMPSDILLACGFPDMPIEMSATRLAEKAAQENHIYSISDVKDLVKELNSPWAVFKYGDNAAKNVIVGIEHNGKQFLVGVHFNQLHNGMEISDIRGIFPKTNAKWLNWIAQGKADYLDKEKIQDLIDKQRTNLAEVEYLDLDLITKLIQDFENPKIKPQNIAKKIKLATGWERGADGKWRYEIPDARVNSTTVNRILGELEYSSKPAAMLYDMLEGAEELLSAYPDLMKLRVVVERGSSSVIPEGRLEWNEEIYDSRIVLNEAAVQSHFAQDALEQYVKADRKLIRIKQGVNPDSGERFSSIDEQKEWFDIYSTMAEESYAKYKRLKGSTLATTTRVILHEVQHAIQFLEGFARGSEVAEFEDLRGRVLDDINFVTSGDFLRGNAISDEQSVRDALEKNIPYTEISVKDAYADKLQNVARKYGYDSIDGLVADYTKFPSAFEQYRRTAGEVEARNVQQRMLMSPEERRASLLAETEDVAREDQIFLEESLGVAQSVDYLLDNLSVLDNLSNEVDELREEYKKLLLNKDKNTNFEEDLKEWRKRKRPVVENYIEELLFKYGFDATSVYTYVVDSVLDPEGSYKAIRDIFSGLSPRKLEEIIEDVFSEDAAARYISGKDAIIYDISRSDALGSFWYERVLIHELVHYIVDTNFTEKQLLDLYQNIKDIENYKKQLSEYIKKGITDTEYAHEALAYGIDCLLSKDKNKHFQKFMQGEIDAKTAISVLKDHNPVLDKALIDILNIFKKIQNESETRRNGGGEKGSPSSTVGGYNISETSGTYRVDGEDLGTRGLSVDDVEIIQNEPVIFSSKATSESSAPKRKSAAEKSLEKINSLREEIKSRKQSLDKILDDVRDFLTSKDIAETMAGGVGKSQYRNVIKNSIEAVRKAYAITNPEEKRVTLLKYLGEIDDSLSQLLTRQRLNEVTNILDKAIYGYTAQGVRTGKRIDEHTREIFNILRNAIAEPVEEERDEQGRRKPVHYRLKNRTADGDITSAFRLRTQSKDDPGVIARLRSEADEILNEVDMLDTAAFGKAMQYEYVANLLTRYDEALQVNEGIGKTTDEITRINNEIEDVKVKYRAAEVGTPERKELYAKLQQLKRELDAEKMNRASLRHRYALMLKTFTTSLEQLDEKGAEDFSRAEIEKAEAAVKWRKGIYNSIKNPDAPVLPMQSKDEQGKDVNINWRGMNTRAKANASMFMATFAEMSRDIDINSIPGQWLRDGWYYQFMLAEGGYMERTDWRYKQETALHKELDEAVTRIFGEMSIKDKLTSLSGNPFNVIAHLAQQDSGMVIPGVAKSINKEGKVVGGYQENVALTIGELLYMRNTVRQPNGYAGYDTWGLSEKDMRSIVEYVEDKYPEYCLFADYVVNAFLPKLYELQDSIYYDKFGTHLPKTAFYFPFVRDKRMVGQIAEVGVDEVRLPSSVTGNIVERVKTSAKMDLEADMFEVLQNHIKETLDWCAYVELTDKFNSLATSHAFGNILKAQGVSVDKLKQMYEIAIGQGQVNSTDNTTGIKVLNAVSRGVVASNIVMNLNAAAKQIVSTTATLGYSLSPKLLGLWAKNYFVPSVVRTGIENVVQQLRTGELNPVEAVNWKMAFGNWKWALENVPTLRERWEGREAGFDVLKSHSFETWDKLTAIITNIGLAPNAFVDMLTCAGAAKTVYEYEYPRLLKRGRDKVEAHREACVKAAVFVNETQQSSLNGFLSSFQSSTGLLRLLGSGLGAYQNSSMAFARNERFSFSNILRMSRQKTRNDMLRRQEQAYRDMGFDSAEAYSLAKADLRESFGSLVSSFVHNGILNNYIWAIAGVVLTTLFSAGIAAMFGNSDEWDKIRNNEEFRNQLATAVSAATILSQPPLLYNAPLWKQGIEFIRNKIAGKTYGGLFSSPTSQEAEELLDAIFKQWVGVKDETTGELKVKAPTRYDRSAEWLVFDALMRAGVGVSPDVVARMAEGVVGMVEDGVHAEDVMNFLSSPRGLTRAIAGDPRENESQRAYLDRVAYIYRMVKSADGTYGSKWEKERIKEYVEKNDAKLYRGMGMDPREVNAVYTKGKAINKGVLIQWTNKDKKFKYRPKNGKETEWQRLTPTQREQQVQMLKLLSQIKDIDSKHLSGIVEFNEERAGYLKQKYDLQVELFNVWNEYIKQ